MPANAARAPRTATKAEWTQIESAQVRKAMSRSIKERTGRARTPGQKGAARKKSLKLLSAKGMRKSTLSALEKKLEEADFQYRTHLAQFRWEDMGTHLGTFDSATIHAAHTNSLAATLSAAGLTESTAWNLAQYNISPMHLHLLGHCRRPWADLLPEANLPDGFLANLDHIEQWERNPRDPGNIDPIEPWMPPADPRVNPVDTNPRTGKLALHYEKELDKLKGESGDARISIAVAQNHLAMNDPQGALTALQGLGKPDKRDSSMLQFQKQTVARTIASLAYLRMDHGQAAEFAGQTLLMSTPGSYAFNDLRVELSSNLTRTSRRSLRDSAARGGKGLVSKARVKAATTALWGSADLPHSLRFTMGREAWMGITDLHRVRNGLINRAFGLSSTHAPADPIQHNMALGVPAIRYWDGLPSMMLSAPIRGHILHHVHFMRPCAPRLPSLPADLFRFDYLRDQALAATDRMSRIEALDMQLRRLLFDQLSANLDGADEALEELTNFVNDLVDQANALAQSVRDEVDTLVGIVRDAAALATLLRVLTSWPHENWVAVLNAFRTRLDAGESVNAAFLGAFDDLLAGEVGAIVNEVVDLIRTTLGSLNDRLHENLVFPQETKDAIVDYLMVSNLLPVEADAVAYVENLFAELEATLSGLDLVALAQPALDDLLASIGSLLPPWVRNLVMIYVVAPFVLAILTLASLLIPGSWALYGLGIISQATIISWAIPMIVVLGVQYLISWALQGLGDLVDVLDDVLRDVDAAMARVEGLVNALTAAVLDAGEMQAMLDGLLARIAALTDLLPPEVTDALHLALTRARDLILGQATTFLAAMERTHMRESLQFVDGLSALSDHVLPLGGSMSGLMDPQYGVSTQVAAAVGAMDDQLVRTLDQVDKVITQTLSLKQVLESQGKNALASFDNLMNGIPIDFQLPMTVMDRLFPGTYGVRIRDVQVHVDFDLEQAGEDVQQVLGTLASSASAIAGDLVDPALDGRIPGGHMPLSPTVPGRIPTGLPLLLRHGRLSHVRIKPTAAHEDAYKDECGHPLHDTCLPPALQGTRLLDDPEEGASNLGYKLLQYDDPKEVQWFSHFSILEDGVRFYPETRLRKPFENQGPNGDWILEVPNLVHGLVDPTGLSLPPIRDVRLVFSLAVRHDDALSAAVKPPELSVTEPVLPDVEDVLDLLPIDLGSVLGDLEGTLADLIDTLMVRIAALDALGDTLADVDLGDPSATVAEQVAEALREIIDQLASANQTIQAVPLDGADLTNLAQVLTGAQAGEWAVDNATLSAYGIDPAKVIGLAGAAVTVIPVSPDPLIGGTIVWPSNTDTSLTWADGGSSATATKPLASGTGSFAPADFSSTPQIVGDWMVQLPSGLPNASGLMVALLVITQSP